MVRPALNCPLCNCNLDIIVSRAFLLCLRGDSCGGGCSDGDGEPLLLRASGFFLLSGEFCAGGKVMPGVVVDESAKTILMIGSGSSSSSDKPASNGPMRRNKFLEFFLQK
jgi:hypothetical protein